MRQIALPFHALDSSSIPCVRQLFHSMRQIALPFHAFKSSSIPCVRQLFHSMRWIQSLFRNSMAQKREGKSSELDNTKITSFINCRGGDISDGARLYRKEEMLKKKLKNILEVNATLQKEIKTHQNQIHDQRASIQFQLTDLNKEMSLKFCSFVQQKLQRQNFLSNSSAHESMQSMMRKYEQIEKECSMLHSIYQSLQNINAHYLTHGEEMEELVVQSERLNQDYEATMETTLSDINEQIKLQISSNEQSEQRTQQLVREIDGYVAMAQEMRQEQQRVLAKIERLKKQFGCQQQKVDEIQEWQQIVIDKSKRKALYRLLKEKQDNLQGLQGKNSQLQIYLNELDNQLQLQAALKENRGQLKPALRTQRSNKTKAKP